MSTTSTPQRQVNNSTALTTTNSNSKAQQQQQQQQQHNQVAAQQQQQEQQPEDIDSRLPQLFPDIPDILEFESWWNERAKITNSSSGIAAASALGGGDSGGGGGSAAYTRRYMLLRFFPETGQVEVQTDDAVVPLTIVVTTRSGAPLRCWDLYVGATIDILGRSTTLHAASFRTMSWLDDNCRRLWRLKERMEHRLNRFVNVPKIALDYGPYKKLVQPSNGTKIQLGGLACPGKIGRTILDIQDQLSQYQ